MAERIRTVLPHERRQTLWFSLEDGGDVKAATRLMFPRPDRPVPMQLADLAPYADDSEGPHCEGSGLYFKRLGHLQVLFYNIARWMCAHAIGRGYVTYDRANPGTRRLYTKHFRFVEIPEHDGLAFEGFVNRKTGHVALWKPVVLTTIETKLPAFRTAHPNIVDLHIPSVDLEAVYRWPTASQARSMGRHLFGSCSRLRHPVQRGGAEVRRPLGDLPSCSPR